MFHVSERPGSFPVAFLPIDCRHGWRVKSFQIRPVVEWPLDRVPVHAEDQVLPKDAPLVSAHFLVTAIVIYELGVWPSVGKVLRDSKIVRVLLPQLSQCGTVLPDSGWRWVIFDRYDVDGPELKRRKNSFAR